MNRQWLFDPQKSGEKLSPVSCFKRGFETTDGQIKIKLSALGLYDCRLDGREITEDIFTPGWCDYRKRAEYQEYILDVGAGEHIVEILLGDGWYAGTIAGNEPFIPMLFAEIELPDGAVLRGDESWLCSSCGPFAYSDIYMGESFDFNSGWKNWHPAAVAEKNLPLEKFDGIPVRRCQYLEPVSVRGNIVDFGQNLTGREIIRFQAPQGTVVTLRHAEVLNPDGSMYTENLRAAKAENRVTASGNVDLYEPTFTFHGFRYLEVTGAGSFEVKAAVIHTDFTEHLKFDSSSVLLNQLVKNIRWGWLDNALDVPTDCPQRDERVGWLGDAQVFIKAALYLTDCRCFFRRWLKDVRLNRDENGFYPIVAPYLKRFAVYDAAGWADAGVICPWQIYEFTSDKSILEENYPAMLTFVNARWQNFQDGKVPFANYGDWLNWEDNTPRELIGTAFLAYSTDLTARTAAVLGDEDNFYRLKQQFEAVKSYFQQNFSAALDSQTAMVLALQFDLLPLEDRPLVAAKLDDHIRNKKNCHLSTGFLGTPHLLHVLSDNGYLHTAWELLEQTTFPGWLFPVLNGATTVWERWNGWTAESGFADAKMNSFNHYAYGAVLDWIIGVAAGISPDFSIDPHPGGSLTHLTAEYRGVSVCWDKSDSEIVYSIKVPAGITAKFRGRALPGPVDFKYSEAI